MATVADPTQAPPAPPTPPARVEQRMVLYAVSWQEYEHLREGFGNRRVRLTYDRGTLEIMTLSPTHEWWKSRIGLLLCLLGGELGVDVQGYGSSTLRRQDLERGLEPDEGFYIRNDQIRGPRGFDLTRDPPPNLVLEVDISRSSLNRMGIYGALGVAEVWRFDGESLHIYHLRPDGTYEERPQSQHFPSLPPAEFVHFLHQTEGQSQSALIGPFLAWARQHALPARQEQPDGA